MKLDREVVDFFHSQNCVIVSSIDKNGYPHSACKGIIRIDPSGRVYLLDIYKAVTYANLAENPLLSVTAIDEHKFSGYCLKGKATIVKEEEIDPNVVKAWEDRLTSRITQRIIKNILDKKGHPRHPEAHFPTPKYMIVMDVDEVVDLTPHQLREESED